MYKTPIPSCGVISEMSTRKIKKRKYRIFVFKNHDFKIIAKKVSLLVSGTIKSKVTLFKLDKSKSWESVSSIKHEVRSDTQAKESGVLPENSKKSVRVKFSAAYIHKNF